jgi:hypothetical protein
MQIQSFRNAVAFCMVCLLLIMAFLFCVCMEEVRSMRTRMHNCEKTVIKVIQCLRE